MTKSITVLGTASQQPTKHRNHNGYFLKWDCHQSTPEGLLFDPGEGIQRQMVFAEISPADVTRVLISHFHGDHCLGLPGIIQAVVNSTKDFERNLEIYYPAASEKFFNNLRFCCAYKTQKLNIIPVPIENEGVVFENKFFTISAMFLKHRMPTLGYRVEEKTRKTMLPDKLKAAGIVRENIKKLSDEGRVEIDGKIFLLEDFSETKPGKVFSFVMDTSPCENAVLLARNADMVMCESTYLSAEEEEAIKNGHMTARHAAETAKAAKAKRLVLTHFSQRYGDVKDFEVEARTIFENCVAVKDGDVLKID